MLRIALASFILSLFAYVIGATGVTGAAMEIGRIFLVGFLVFAVAGVALDLARGSRPKDVL